MIDLVRDDRKIHAAKINAVINMTVLDMGDVNRDRLRSGIPGKFPEDVQELSTRQEGL